MARPQEITKLMARVTGELDKANVCYLLVVLYPTVEPHTFKVGTGIVCADAFSPEQTPALRKAVDQLLLNDGEGVPPGSTETTFETGK